MKSFFIFGITDFQDMFPAIISFSKFEKIWVGIFDCLDQKNQFYYYSKDELINFVNLAIKKNGNINNANVFFYGKNEIKKYQRDMNSYNPSIILMQGISHKYPLWLPMIGQKPVAHFTWGADGVNNIKKSPYKSNLVLNVLRHPEDTILYDKLKVPSQYFGNFWIESIKNFKHCGYESINKLEKKIFFMPESWLKKDNKKWCEYDVKKYIDPIIKIAKENNYYVLVKKKRKRTSYR